MSLKSNKEALVTVQSLHFLKKSISLKGSVGRWLAHLTRYRSVLVRSNFTQGTRCFHEEER